MLDHNVAVSGAVWTPETHLLRLGYGMGGGGAHPFMREKGLGPHKPAWMSQRMAGKEYTRNSYCHRGDLS